jgi:hypothetical protein
MLCDGQHASALELGGRSLCMQRVKAAVSPVTSWRSPLSGGACSGAQEYLAVGEAPTEIRNCFQQRSRWTKVPPVLAPSTSPVSALLHDMQAKPFLHHVPSLYPAHSLQNLFHNSEHACKHVHAC